MTENILKFQPIPKRFMVWDKGLGKFIKYAGEKVYDLPLLTDLLGTYNVVEIDEDLIIVQSTNLFDKDGKEIFEGSIIRDNSYIVEGKPLVGVVVPHNKIAAFTLSKRANRASNLLLSDGPRYEIIGHVLSNPELLEGRA